MHALKEEKINNNKFPISIKAKIDTSLHYYYNKNIKVKNPAIYFKLNKESTKMKLLKTIFFLSLITCNSLIKTAEEDPLKKLQGQDLKNFITYQSLKKTLNERELSKYDSVIQKTRSEIKKIRDNILSLNTNFKTLNNETYKKGIEIGNNINNLYQEEKKFIQNKGKFMFYDEDINDFYIFHNKERKQLLIIKNEYEKYLNMELEKKRIEQALNYNKTELEKLTHKNENLGTDIISGKTNLLL